MNSSAVDTAQQSDSPSDKKSWKVWLKRGVTLFFFILVPTLLFMMLKDTDWQEVWDSLQAYGAPVLLGGVAIAAVSFAVFCSYDLLGRLYTQHGLPLRQVYPIAFVCYAFNLNLGAWIGGIALRYRLYTRHGLEVATVTRILSISLLANWVGYMLLAGTVFSLRLMDLPDDWKIGNTGLQLIGFVLLALSVGYLLACQFSSKRTWSWRKHEMELPSLKLALMQVTLGAVNWSLMAALIYLLLPEGVFYPTVLGILLVSSIAGVVTHIPAGLGVLEAIFIALFQHEIATGALLAALIGYRAIYFLLPLVIAVVVYIIIEKRAPAVREADGQSQGNQGAAGNA